MQYNFGNDHEETPFEVILSLVLIRFVLLALMLMFVMPRQEIKTADAKVKDRGVMRVECVWENGTDVDVDLWGKAPVGATVGFLNKNGEVFDLVRDDVGRAYNPSGIHYEILYARDTPPGEYIINVHLYRNGEKATKPIVPVECWITMGKAEGGDKREIFTRKVELTHENDEITIASFTLDGNKELVEKSISKVNKPLATKPS